MVGLLSLKILRISVRKGYSYMDSACLLWEFQNTLLCDKVGFLPVLIIDKIVTRNRKGMGFCH